MKTCIHIGHTGESTKATGQLILDILSTRADQKTIRAALKTLGQAHQISGVTLSGCTVNSPTYYTEAANDRSGDEREDDDEYDDVPER